MNCVRFVFASDSFSSYKSPKSQRRKEISLCLTIINLVSKMIINLKKLRNGLRLAILIGFSILIGLDIYIQIDAYFISKSFWKPPLLTWLVIVLIIFLISGIINQILTFVTTYPYLSATIIGILTVIAYNRWIRRKKPDYIVMKDFRDA